MILYYAIYDTLENMLLYKLTKENTFQIKVIEIFML